LAAISETRILSGARNASSLLLASPEDPVTSASLDEAIETGHEPGASSETVEWIEDEGPGLAAAVGQAGPVPLGVMCEGHGEGLRGAGGLGEAREPVEFVVDPVRPPWRLDDSRNRSSTQSHGGVGIDPGVPVPIGRVRDAHPTRRGGRAR